MTISSLTIYLGIIALLISAALIASAARMMRREERRMAHERRVHMMDETRASHEADRLWRHEHPRDTFDE